jgi:hypothetical protein
MKLKLSMVAVSCLIALNTPCFAQTADSTAQAQPPPAAASAVATTTVVVCHDVQDRTPVDAGESFASDVGTLCCFSNVTGANEPVQVYHRWYVGDRMVSEIPIMVKAASWRCWSRKTIQPSWTGPCHVDVVTEAGDTIGSATFTLTAASAAAPPQG